MLSRRVFPASWLTLALPDTGPWGALADEGKGKGMVIALHDMNLAARFCDDLLAVKSGRIITHSPAAQVFRANLLSGLFDARVEVAEASGRPVAVAEAAG